jgi:hypothetical protein
VLDGFSEDNPRLRVASSSATNGSIPARIHCPQLLKGLEPARLKAQFVAQGTLT